VRPASSFQQKTQEAKPSLQPSVSIRKRMMKNPASTSGLHSKLHILITSRQNELPAAALADRHKVSRASRPAH
jgi:hypothetical protein